MMLGNRFLETSVPRASEMLDGFEHSQLRVEELLRLGEFDKAFHTSEALASAIRRSALPFSSITTEDRARLGDLMRRNINTAKQVGRLMEKARLARRKSETALQVYKKY